VVTPKETPNGEPQDIYQQFVPESQRRAVNSLMQLPTNGVIQ